MDPGKPLSIKLLPCHWYKIHYNINASLNIFRRKSERAAILQLLADKVQWFKDHLKPEAKICSIQEVHDLINM